MINMIQAKYSTIAQHLKLLRECSLRISTPLIDFFDGCFAGRGVHDGLAPHGCSGLACFGASPSPLKQTFPGRKAHFRKLDELLK